MQWKVPFKLSALLVALNFPVLAWCEVITSPTQIPTSTLPSQVSNALASRAITKQRTPLPAIATPQQSPENLGPEAAKIKFKLIKLVISGNTVYSDEKLQSLFQDQIGKKISVQDLMAIVMGITNYYRNNGYILTRAILPPQRVRGGVVHVRVIEGYIDHVNVGGEPHGARCIALAYGLKMAECKPLRLDRMEKYLLLANELPATEVRAVLSPAINSVGAADLMLNTINRPVTGYFSYDNYGTRYIGPQQMTANLGFNSFISSGDSTQVTVTKTPKGGELNFIDVNYGLPVNDLGTKFLIGGTRAHTHPLFVLQETQIDGLNNNYYTSLQYPVIRSRSESLTLQLAFNYLDSEVTSFNTQLYNDHLRSLGLGANYNAADRFRGVNGINFEFRQGLPILGYSSNYNPDTAQVSRPGGRGDYTKFTLSYSRMQALYGALSFYGVVKGQWAFNPLLAAEQFAFGGNQLGRGYDVAEIIGDKGLAGTLEFRYDASIGKRLLQSIQFYTFYDIGKVWNLKSFPGLPTSISAAAMGFGGRVYFGKHLSGNLMWAQPATKPVSALQFIGDGHRPRVFFSLVLAS